MNARQRRDKPPKRGQRHPLLLQKHLNEQLFWVSILILAACGGLLVWNPPPFVAYHPHLTVVFCGTGLILILTFAYRLRAYAQCRAEVLHVQLPFYHLSIPYTDIRATRPNQFFRIFPPKEQRWTQRYFLRWLWGTTAVVVELEELPAPRPWLRLWLSPYMFDLDEVGLVLPVRDWMALRSELDEFLSRHRRQSVYRP